MDLKRTNTTSKTMKMKAMETMKAVNKMTTSHKKVSTAEKVEPNPQQNPLANKNIPLRANPSKNNLNLTSQNISPVNH